MDDTLQKLRAGGLVPGLFVLLAAGCGTTVIKQYVPPEMPSGSRAATPFVSSEVDGPWRRKTLDVVDHDVIAPEPEVVAIPERSNEQAIREANKAATYDPKDAEEEGGVRRWDYDPTVTYRVYACPLETFQIRLAVGESLTDEPTFGNAGTNEARLWRLSKAKSGDGHGQLIWILNLRPNLPKIPRQRFQVYTNVGPYDFELNVLPKGEDCMRAVAFRHLTHEWNEHLIKTEDQADGEPATAAAPGRGPFSADRCASEAYEIEVMQGSPNWVPLRAVRSCIADHARVYIQFPDSVAWSKIPALKADNGVRKYDYDASARKMVVEGMFNNATLSLGSEQTGYEKVSIRALRHEVKR